MSALTLTADDTGNLWNVGQGQDLTSPVALSYRLLLVLMYLDQ